MERFVKGEVVVTPFPFSDLSSNVKRPALVVANIKGDDVILCQITSQKHNDEIIALNKKDFQEGNLRVDSYIKITRLFTVHNSLILYKVGKLKKEKIREVENKFCEMFTR